MTGKMSRWATPALLVCWTLLPTFLSYFWGFQDFYQDWASARNWWEGIAVYSPHSETVPRYLGKDFALLPNGKLYPIVATVKINAHPPSSVLLYLPFALLPYGVSYLTWNLISGLCLTVSAVVVVRELAIVPSRCALLGLGVLGLLGGPVFEQMVFGQTNAVTMAFLVLAWHCATARLAGAGRVLARIGCARSSSPSPCSSSPSADDAGARSPQASGHCC